VDLAWDDPRAQRHALPLILDALSPVEHGLETQPVPAEPASQVAATLTVGQQVRVQDIVTTPDGPPTWRQGVAAERRSSSADGEMRHGRQSRSLLVDGSKRHGRRDLDSRLMVAVGVTPAHAPEASVPDAMETDWAAQQGTLREWHIDRASLASPLVQQRAETLAMFCQAWPVRQGPYGPKTACPLAGERSALRCPGGEIMPLTPGEVGKVPAATCARCALRERCT